MVEAMEGCCRRVVVESDVPCGIPSVLGFGVVEYAVLGSILWVPGVVEYVVLGSIPRVLVGLTIPSLVVACWSLAASHFP